MENFHGTTIVCVKKNDQVAMAGDGQVTLGHTAIKHSAKKVRKIYGDKVMVGFAGATAGASDLRDNASRNAFSPIQNK